MTGVHKSQVTKFCTVVSSAYLWVLSMELAVCCPSGILNSEFSPRFLENLCSRVV